MGWPFSDRLYSLVSRKKRNPRLLAEPGVLLSDGDSDEAAPRGGQSGEVTLVQVDESVPAHPVGEPYSDALGWGADSDDGTSPVLAEESAECRPCGCLMWMVVVVGGGASDDWVGLGDSQRGCKHDAWQCRQHRLPHLVSRGLPHSPRLMAIMIRA